MHRRPDNVVEALSTLNTADLLTSDTAQANFNAVLGHQYPNDAARALKALDISGLLTGDSAQHYRSSVVAHESSEYVAKALGTLNTAGLLSGENAQANFNAVIALRNPCSLPSVLNTLYTAGLLTGNAAQANFDTVVSHHRLYHLASALNILSTVGLLTTDAAQANFNTLFEHQYPDEVAGALRTLYNAGLLTGGEAQINFNALVITHTAILLNLRNHRGGVNLWDLIPHGRPTAAEFQAMITIAQDHADNPDAGSLALTGYVGDRLLDMIQQQINNLQQNIRQQAVNPSQSTHTASVHASASQSATNLLTRYRSNLVGRRLDNAVREFASSVWVHTPNNHKHRAATRCIDRLTHRDYFYTDNVSQISTKQLMALTWKAITDETFRIGTLNDAKQQLIEGLYEIQRGYNLSEMGVDDNNPEDRPICTAGTFNKLIEKLAGLHPDVSVIYITQAGATAKLRIVAVEEAQSYLNTLVFGTEEYLTLQNNFSNNNMQPLWDIIAPQVASRLFEEFGSLYPEGRTSPDFVNCVEQGIYALTTESLVLPTAPINLASVATNPHVLFQPNEDDNLNAVQVEASLNTNNR